MISYFLRYFSFTFFFFSFLFFFPYCVIVKFNQVELWYKQVYYQQSAPIPEYKSTPTYFNYWLIAIFREYQYLQTHRALLYSFVNSK